MDPTVDGSRRRGDDLHGGLRGRGGRVLWCHSPEILALRRRREREKDGEAGRIRGDLVIPDGGRVAAVYMLRGRLEAPAAGMVVFLGDDVGRDAGVWVGDSDRRTSGVHGGLCNREQER